MTWYVEILATQEPFDLSLDNENRATVGFNITVQKRPGRTFLEEIAKRLEDQGVGTRNVDIFATSKAEIPISDKDESKTYLSIIPTAGTFSLDIHNEDAPSYPRPGALILVRAPSYESAETMAWDAYDALAGLRNIELTG